MNEAGQSGVTVRTGDIWWSVKLSISLILLQARHEDVQSLSTYGYLQWLIQLR